MNITEANCNKYTGHPLSYFLQLSGIYGLYSQFDYNSDAVEYNFEFEDGRFTVEIETTLVDLTRVINLELNSITNELIEATDEGKERGNIALDVLESQIRFACQYNFDIIKIQAYRAKNHANTKYDGYSIWPQYGFEMYYAEQVEWFLELMKNLRLPYKNVYELLYVEDGVKRVEGFDIWKLHGEKWNGSFDLKDGSNSRTIFNKVLKRKGRKII